MNHVAAVDLELRMRGVFDFQQQVAATVALSGKPDRLTGLDAFGDAYFQRFAGDRQPHRIAAIDRFQRHRDLGTRHTVSPRARARTAGSTARARTAAAAEHFLEKIAEAAIAAAGKHFLEIDASRATAETAGRRLHFIAGAITARAQLVVSRAFLRVAQGFVGFVDRLEGFFSAGFLADIRMIFAREPAIGGFDFRLTGAGLDPEHVVVILETHIRFCADQRCAQL